MNKKVYPSTEYPKDGERIFYFFTPFERWYEGVFHSEESAEEEDKIYGSIVTGNSGFTTWFPEVSMWMKVEEDMI